MRYFYFVMFYFIISNSSSHAQFTPNAGIGSAYKYLNNLAGTGVEAIYFFNSFSGATLSYTTSEQNIEFFEYTKSIADKQQISDDNISISSDGIYTTYSLHNLHDSKAYFAEINGNATNVTWVFDYILHIPILNSIEPYISNDDCETIKLKVDKKDDLFFYAVGGGVHRITRLYQIEYNTLEWNTTDNEFDNKTINSDWVDIGTEINVTAPLVDTEFTITGDQIGQHFNLQKILKSKIYSSVSVKGYILAQQVSKDSDSGYTQQLGGSAPAEIIFNGYANEPIARFYTWYIYKKSDMQNPLHRYTDKDIKYTFKEAGDYVVKLNVYDRNSICSSSSSTEFSITEFEWDVPNYFLIGGEKKFKISYKSIIKFKCTIFNRWNTKIYEWTDPSEGWDGKYNGKYVDTGVYFYVMTAISGDGKTHKKAGDINVFKKDN